MKIVNRTQFLAMPPGVIFSTGEKWAFFEWRMKGETSGTNDFFYTSLDWSAFDYGSTDEFLDKLDECLDKGSSLPLMFDGIERDGMYDDKALFAVMEYKDILAFVATMFKATPA
jgi:hypothetical protein